MENKKIHLTAKIIPYDLKFALIFDGKETIYEIFYFIDETMRKNRLKYKTGRIEKNKIIILPQFFIKDFLENNDEINVYPIEYGLNLKQLDNNNDFEFEKEDINKIYINRKTKRKDKGSSNPTRKNSKEYNKNIENNSNDNNNNNKSDYEEENKKNKKKSKYNKEESDEEENNSNNNNNDEENEEEEEENTSNENNKSSDESDNDDIKIPKNKNK